MSNRPFYEITEADVGSHTIIAFGHIWDMRQVLGHILKQDIGKRVYQVGTIVQVENDEQRDQRVRGK